MPEIKVITLPIDDALNFMRTELQNSKAELLNEMISFLGGVKWQNYGDTLSKKEVGQIFNRKSDTVDRWIEQGVLKSIKVNNTLVGIPKESVMKLYYQKR